jgi:2-polyprenyl-3-methyl-5-hydroxy-6-metoxy-1,4-benzoquinol methylase
MSPTPATVEAPPSRSAEEPARHLYDYAVDPASDTAPARVCRLVGSGKRVLEIGAGPGSITRVLRAQHNRVTALEVDPTALPHLSPHCDEVVSADLNRPDWVDRLGGARFDAVVAADVLEHLEDPWSTLGRMKQLLAPSGVIVVSVPHASHACVIACLLDEDVQYGDWGLLDRTHVRFFGLRNVQAMFEKAQLKLVAGEFVVRAPEETEFKDKWSALPREARRFLSKQPFAHVYQVVVMAADRSDPRPALDLMQLRVRPSLGDSARIMLRSVTNRVLRGRGA